MSNAERDALLGGDAERERRRAAMDGVERASENAERLERTSRTARESATTGENILTSLREQRDKILSARASAGHMERDMDKSERRMTQLGCEKCVQRWAFCVLVTLVLGGLGVFLWWKLHRGNDARDDEHHKQRSEAMLARAATAGFDVAREWRARRLLRSN